MATWTFPHRCSTWTPRAPTCTRRTRYCARPALWSPYACPAHFRSGWRPGTGRCAPSWPTAGSSRRSTTGRPGGRARSPRPLIGLLRGDNMALVLPALFERFPDISLAERPDTLLSVGSVILNGPVSLPVNLRPLRRHPPLPRGCPAHLDRPRTRPPQPERLDREQALHDGLRSRQTAGPGSETGAGRIRPPRHPIGTQPAGPHARPPAGGPVPGPAGRLDRERRGARHRYRPRRVRNRTAVGGPPSPGTANASSTRSARCSSPWAC